jgi:hypothetical protein
VQQPIAAGTVTRCATVTCCAATHAHAHARVLLGLPGPAAAMCPCVLKFTPPDARGQPHPLDDLIWRRHLPNPSEEVKELGIPTQLADGLAVAAAAQRNDAAEPEECRRQHEIGPAGARTADGARAAGTGAGGG